MFSTLPGWCFPGCSARRIRWWTNTLIFTYILGTYWIRLAMALLEAPFMYAARWFLPDADRGPTKRATRCEAGDRMTFSYPNFAFDIIATDPAARARGRAAETPHGALETPAFIFCATKAAMKACSPAMPREEKTQIILSNTYHLMLQPGADLVAKMGGLHRFMGWDGPMLTDSGGFQIFSLGHGSVADEIKGRRDIARPKTLLKISEKGAAFRSYIDGSKHR